MTPPVVYAICAGSGLAVYLLLYIEQFGLDLRQNISPDGWQYAAMARGEHISVPYALRWLLPWLIKERTMLGSIAFLWRVVCSPFIVALGPLAAWYASTLGFEWQLQLFSALLVLGLPGVLRTSVYFPVLPDGVATSLMLLSVCLCSQGHPWLGAGAAVLGATCRETVPVFAALGARSWKPLLGLIAVLLRYLQVRGRESYLVSGQFTEAGKASFELRLSGIAKHQKMWTDIERMVLPWGVCLLGLWRADLWMLAAATCAYGQLLVGCDTTRLYQWMFPVMARAAVQVASLFPRSWLLPLLIVHWTNPWRRNWL